MGGGQVWGPSVNLLGALQAATRVCCCALCVWCCQGGPLRLFLQQPDSQHPASPTTFCAPPCTLPAALAVQVSSPAKRLPPHEAVSTPHWGNPAAVRFSRSGARFGAVGEGGLVGLWRQDFISAVDGMGHAEWVGHCLSRSGTAIAFLGDTGSQVRGGAGGGLLGGGRTGGRAGGGGDAVCKCVPVCRTDAGSQGPGMGIMYVSVL